jgi:hypothetical protein
MKADLCNRTEFFKRVKIGDKVCLSGWGFEDSVEVIDAIRPFIYVKELGGFKLNPDSLVGGTCIYEIEKHERWFIIESGWDSVADEIEETLKNNNK